MRRRNFKREFRLHPQSGKIRIGCGMAVLVITLATSGVRAIFAPQEITVFYALTILILLAFVALAASGVWILFDRRPRVITDENGITDRRQSGGPLSLGWNEIRAISLENEAILRLVTRTTDGESTYQIWLLGLDAPGGEIFDHVLKCHAAHGPQMSAVAPPQPIPQPKSQAKTPLVPLPETDEPGAIREQTFHGRKLFRPDLRIIGGILSVFAFAGIIISCAGDGSNEFGKLTSKWAVSLTAMSVLAGITGTILIAITVRDHGWKALPQDGWPKLQFSDDALTLEPDQGEEIRILWSRMRKIVPILVRYNNGAPKLIGYTVYYATKKAKISSYVVNVYAYAEPDAVVAAFSGLSFTRDTGESEPKLNGQKPTRKRFREQDDDEEPRAGLPE